MELSPASTPEILTVCGGRVEDPGRTPSAVHRGRRLYFCNRACLEAFQKEPDRFLAGEIPHPTSEDEAPPA